jgi:hypothetical protein
MHANVAEEIDVAISDLLWQTFMLLIEYLQSSGLLHLHPTV